MDEVRAWESSISETERSSTSLLTSSSSSLYSQSEEMERRRLLRRRSPSRRCLRSIGDTERGDVYISSRKRALSQGRHTSSKGQLGSFFYLQLFWPIFGVDIVWWKHVDL